MSALSMHSINPDSDSCSNSVSNEPHQITIGDVITTWNRYIWTLFRQSGSLIQILEQILDIF